MDEVSARAKYARHKASARRRNIEFDLTFEDWMSIWGPRLELIGRQRDDMQMCRTHDSGGYKVGNVRIDTQRANAIEAAMERKIRRGTGQLWRGATVGARRDESDWLWRRNVFSQYSEDEDA
jgi:hypothetical protein